MTLKQLQAPLGSLNDAFVTQEMLKMIPKQLMDEGVASYSQAQCPIREQLFPNMRDSLFQFLGKETRHELAQMIIEI